MCGRRAAQARKSDEWMSVFGEKLPGRIGRFELHVFTHQGFLEKRKPRLQQLKRPRQCRIDHLFGIGIPVRSNRHASRGNPCQPRLLAKDDRICVVERHKGKQHRTKPGNALRGYIGNRKSVTLNVISIWDDAVKPVKSQGASKIFSRNSLNGPKTESFRKNTRACGDFLEMTLRASV